MDQMRFNITFTRSSSRDLAHFRAFEQRVIVDAIKSRLLTEAGTESRNRKPLRPNELATWELRIGAFRVFYDIDDDEVKIIAIGEKARSDLYIRGKRVEL